MIRIMLIVSLLLLQGFIPPEKSGKESIQLWTAGHMHQDEVIGKTGQKWFALYRTSNSFELRTTNIVVLDSSVALYNKFVKVDQSFEVIFLVRGLANLTEGPVKTVFSGHQYVKPGQSVSLELSKGLNFSYQLYAEGNEDREAVNNYKIVLYSNQHRQTLLERATMSLDGSPSLLWAGDLDRDGKLDLLIDLTDHYNATEPTLFLSSRATPNELIKKVASQRRLGC